MRKANVGVYWTLPVNWIGFRSLSPDVDAAAAASRTIRYQRARVRRFVQEDGGELVAEIAFMDVRTDRATDAIRDVLRLKPSVISHGPRLLAVAFDAEQGWRPNPFLAQAADELGIELCRVPPDPIVIDGVTFDPARHFAAWRRRDEAAMTALRIDAHAALRAAMAAIPAGPGRWRRIAERLNERGVRTIRGGAWSAENVRKLVGRTQQ